MLITKGWFIMRDNAKIAELQDMLRLQKGLQNISNCINAAKSAKQIMMETRPLLIDLFHVEAAHIYFNDKDKKEMFTFILYGDQTKDRKAFVNHQTIPGYVMSLAKMINISDFSNPEQINRHPDLPLDAKGDTRFGLPVKQILAMPIFHGGDIVGAVELINKKDADGQFKDKESALLHNIAEVLGIALYNQQQVDPKARKSKYGYLIINSLITEENLNHAREESRVTKEPLENILMAKYKISKEDILKYIDFFFGGNTEESTFTDILGKLETSEDGSEDDREDAVDESDSAIIQLVNKIIGDAIVRRTSDIHIEPNVIDKNVLVRFRIDGDCIPYQTVPYSYRAALISRIKIMANMDITVKRIPQDGKIKLKRSNAEEVELRIVTIPTQGNVEDVVMRILAKGDALPLAAMGMTKKNYNDLLKICELPYGMILCVGPTGSGKTTTLHAILNHINKPDRKGC